MDYTLTGSAANYSWTEKSDIDLHVVVDLADVDATYKDTIVDYFSAKKNVWNTAHNITIHDIPVEFYVQDVNEKHHSTGIYSIKHSEWTELPNHEPPSIDDIAVKNN